jgi:hypothetical protein
VKFTERDNEFLEQVRTHNAQLLKETIVYPYFGTLSFRYYIRPSDFLYFAEYVIIFEDGRRLRYKHVFVHAEILCFCSGPVMYIINNLYKMEE